MGFIRDQEIRLAMKLLDWKYKNMKMPVPNRDSLKQQAEKVVEDAHRIAKEKGHNLIDIMKDLINDIKKK